MTPDTLVTLTKADRDISRGFDAGNYASAYQTTDYAHAIASLSTARTPEYVAAFTLGFLSSLEMGESEHEAYSDALALVGDRARELGIAVD